MEDGIKSTKAYLIFKSELSKHITSFEELLEKAALGQDMSKDEMQRFSAAFHTVKGGAGFFGLEAIARLAGELEVLLGGERLLDEDFAAVKKSFAKLKIASKDVIGDL